MQGGHQRCLALKESASDRDALLLRPQGRQVQQEGGSWGELSPDPCAPSPMVSPPHNTEACTGGAEG